MLFKRISCFLLSSIFAAAVLATPVHAAEKQTPSGLSFSDVGNDIETFVQENEDELASIQTAVFCDQTTLYEGYFGYANKENEMLSDQNTVYEWGSVSKLFVWVSIMQLYEQDFVKLDADIRTYLPAGFLTKTAYTDPITLIDLMNHTAGWQETICSLEVADEAELVPLEYALKNTEPAQVYAPGEVTAYSNWGAALAGYIVQYVSGQDYAEYVHEHILDPLGMEHTSVAADYRDNMWVREQREKLSSYLKSESMERALGQSMSYILLYPAGSATGTLEDMATFGKAFVSDNTPLFHKQETLEKMLEVTSFLGDTDIPNNCHGLWASQYAVDTLGHNGNTNACSANLVFDTESRVGVAVLTNEIGESTFCGGIPSLIFGNPADNKSFQNTEITEREDVSGAYIYTRGFRKGFPKLLTYLSFFPVKSTKDEDVYAVASATLTRIGNHQYLFDDGEGQTTLVCSDMGADGKMTMHIAGMDLVKDDHFYLKLAAIIIYAVMAPICIITLIVSFIIFLVKKDKRRKKSKLLPTIQIFGSLSVIAFLLYLILGCFPITPSNNRVFCIIEAALALFCLASSLVLLKSTFSEKEKKVFTVIQQVLFSLYGLFVYGFTFFFELYNFWGC